ncbi:MAG: molybdopterin-binding protein, partial [Pseudomonadota bacterium]
SALTKASKTADVIITTGGMSVGDADYLPRLFEQLGGESAAIKVAMKPGKPLTVGRLGAAIFLGLPGNPVSVFTTFALIGARTLRRRAGFSDSLPIRIQARVNFSLKRRPGRVEFRPATIIGYAGPTPVLSVAESGFSARISTLASASGFAVFPPGLIELAPGDTCDFIPFSPLAARY